VIRCRSHSGSLDYLSEERASEHASRTASAPCYRHLQVHTKHIIAHTENEAGNTINVFIEDEINDSVIFKKISSDLGLRQEAFVEFPPRYHITHPNGIA
jgi:hypothetical protein